jgi:hypothetical protein
MLPLVNRLRLVTIIIAAAAATAALSACASWARLRRHPLQRVAAQDGKPNGFPGAEAVSQEGEPEKATIDATARQMDAVAKSVTFHADPAVAKP